MALDFLFKNQSFVLQEGAGSLISGLSTDEVGLECRTRRTSQKLTAAGMSGRAEYWGRESCAFRCLTSKCDGRSRRSLVSRTSQYTRRAQ